MTQTRVPQHAACSQLVDSRLCKMDQAFYANPPIDPMLRVRSISLDAIDILRDDGSCYREGLHNYGHIRAQPRDDILITLPLASNVCQTQSGRVAEVSRGAYAMLSTSRPFRTRMSRPVCSGESRAIMARVSADSLRQKFPRLDDCVGIPVQLRPGAGTVMRKLLDLALDEGPLLPADQRLYLGRTLLDAIGESMLAAPELAHLKQPHHRASVRYLYERAKLFIVSNLGDPDLSVEAVARHCNVSPRYLRNVFAKQEGHAVVAFIREQRLLRCRSELIDGTLSDKPIANVAMAWGFNDPAYFSKAYRQRFGTTPTQDRKR